MKTRGWILGVLILSGWTAPLLRAQTFALPFSLTQPNPALTFGIDTNGTFTESGPLNSSATFTFSNNPELVWFPALGPFGRVSSGRRIPLGIQARKAPSDSIQ